MKPASLLLSVFLLISLVAVCHGAPTRLSGMFSPSGVEKQQGPTWPKAFSARFETTILEFNIFSANSSLYYDYTIPAQRIDFDVCSDGTPGACSLIFVSSGAYRLSYEDGTCCKVAPVGPPFPTWPTILAYNGTSRVLGQDVDVWVGGTPVHRLFHNPQTNSMAFLLVEDIYEQWAVQEPFRLGPQDPALFELPSHCSVC